MYVNLIITACTPYRTLCMISQSMIQVQLYIYSIYCTYVYMYGRAPCVYIYLRHRYTGRRPVGSIVPAKLGIAVSSSVYLALWHSHPSIASQLVATIASQLARLVTRAVSSMYICSMSDMHGCMGVITASQRAMVALHDCIDDMAYDAWLLVLYMYQECLHPPVPFLTD